MIETLVLQIVKALREISEWPWAWQGTGDKDNSWSMGLAMDKNDKIVSGECEEEDTPIEEICQGDDGLHHASFLASSPIWLAQMVVGVVEERSQRYLNLSFRKSCPHDVALCKALHDFGLTKDDWTWLKGKVEE